MNTNIKIKKANAYRLTQEKLRNKALSKGVNLIAPETIFLSNDTTFGKNVTVEPYVVIGAKVKIGNNAYIKSFTHIEGTKIEKNVVVGPYARLRPGTILKSNTKIGNFVETKKSSINTNSKVNHLSYIGDSIIGLFIIGFLAWQNISALLTLTTLIGLLIIAYDRITLIKWSNI